MTRPGPKPRPYLAVIREGNPGHRRREPGMVLTGELAEPDWAELLPGPREMARCRRVAAGLWSRLAPVLERSAGLSGEMGETLTAYCITWARLDQAERGISRTGLTVKSDRGGQVKNPLCTVASQYRAAWRQLAGELGLTPSAAQRVSPRGFDEDEDDPFA